MKRMILLFLAAVMLGSIFVGVAIVLLTGVVGAAIANAIFAATGVRLREMPFKKTGITV